MVVIGVYGCGSDGNRKEWEKYGMMGYGGCLGEGVGFKWG